MIKEGSRWRSKHTGKPLTVCHVFHDRVEIKHDDSPAVTYAFPHSYLLDNAEPIVEAPVGSRWSWKYRMDTGFYSMTREGGDGTRRFWRLKHAVRLPDKLSEPPPSEPPPSQHDFSDPYLVWRDRKRVCTKCLLVEGSYGECYSGVTRDKDRNWVRRHVEEGIAMNMARLPPLLQPRSIKFSPPEPHINGFGSLVGHYRFNSRERMK